MTVRRGGASIAAMLAASAVFAPACAGSTAERADFSWVDGTRGRSAGPAVSVRWARDFAEPGSGGRYVPVERAAPAIDTVRDRLYVGSTRGVLWALSHDGKVLYEYRAGAAIEAQPAVDRVRGEVYVATVTGELAALDGEDGGVRWKAQAGAAISQQPVLLQDAVYVVTDEDSVFAFARADGSVLWRYRREPREGFSIAGHAGLGLAGDNVLAAFDDGAIVALDAADGRVRWEIDTSLDLEELDPTRRFVDVDTTPVEVDGVVYAASFSGGLYGIDLASGTVRLHENQLTTITALTATRDALIASSAEQGVMCLDLPGLTPRWQRKSPLSGAPGRAQVHGDTLYVAESLGGLVALALADGREVGRIHTAHGITAAPALERHRGFVLSNAATLFAFTY